MNNSKNYTKCFVGLLLIVIGIIYTLKSFNLINFSICNNFSIFWPIGIILAGFALLIRLKFLAFCFIFITCLIGILYIVDHNFVYHNDFEKIDNLRTIEKEIVLENKTKYLDLDIDFGAGDIQLKKGSNDVLFKNSVKTYNLNDPVLDYKTSNSNAKIEISRNSYFNFFHPIKENWDIEVSPNVKSDINFEVGASNIDIDLTNLQISNLDIDSGATKIKIKFNTYPTIVDIYTGASTVDLEFPQNIGIVIDIDGGAISKNLNGFIKEDNKYYSENYNEDLENIVVDINAGVTTINSKFFE
jgi:cell wall-active antibiotic response 4TMS protein YvqF/uncharacterized protein DUF2154